ncbi:MAG: hypothetical protein ACPK7O_05955 [Methanobacterium sp.]
MKTARLIVFLCAAAMVILGLYSFFVNNDNLSGIAWTFLGVLFFILGYIRVK